jgi:hypothetical protein
MTRLHGSVLFVLTFALGSCASGDGLPRKAKTGSQQEQRRRGEYEAGEPDVEELKRGTGISQVGRVVPGGPALASTLTPGVEQDRLWSDRDDWEPVVAADRSSDFVYQMTTRLLDANSSVVIFRASSDGGETFGPDQRLSRTARGQYDPQLAVAGEGTVFACWLEVPGWETFVARSFDHGATWTTPVVVETNLSWTDHPWIAVSDDGRDVYVAFNRSDSYVVASHDGGAHFGLPVRTHQTDRVWYHTGGAVASDGRVYFAAAEYPSFGNGPIRIYVLRSIDRGASFQGILMDRSQQPPFCGEYAGCYWGFIGPCTGLAVDSAGAVMVAYNAGRVYVQPQQIYVRTSRDGIDWTPAEQLSLPARSANNCFPVVVAGPTPGDFSVVWQGTREPGSPWNTILRRTLDGGQTWGPEQRLSTRGEGAPYQSTKGYDFVYGDYMGASSDGLGRVHAIWGASVSYDGPGGTWYTRTK